MVTGGKGTTAVTPRQTATSTETHSQGEEPTTTYTTETPSQGGEATTTGAYMAATSEGDNGKLLHYACNIKLLFFFKS